MSETPVRNEPTCPCCGAQWTENGPYFAVDGGLSNLPFEDATLEYEEDPDRYDDTSVDRFACGTILANGWRAHERTQ